MKNIIILFSIFFVVAFGELTEQQKQKLQAYRTTCITESGVNPTVIQNVKNGVSEGDENFACFATCMLKKIGIMNADGSVNVEVARTKLPPGLTVEQINDLFNNCETITGNGCEKGGKLLKCIMSKNISII